VDSPYDDPSQAPLTHATFERGTSLVERTPQTEAEVEAIRTAVMHEEGLLALVFDVLIR
jgi:hypothetical protein